jgi:hypothetical protein
MEFKKRVNMKYCGKKHDGVVWGHKSGKTQLTEKKIIHWT